MSEDEIRELRNTFEDMCRLLSIYGLIPLSCNSIDGEYELFPVQCAWEKFLANIILAKAGK